MNIIKIMVIYAVAYFTFVNLPVLAIAPDVALKDKPIPQIVEHFAKEYKTSPTLLVKVMNCESSGRQSAVGDSGKARGIFQFHKPTWDRFTDLMGETLDRENAVDQAKVASWAFAHGYQSHWTCYRTVMKGKV
jgi:hypothetical protein